MRSPVVLAIVVFGLGAALWAFAALTAFGNVSGESSDAAQIARIIEPVPRWVAPAKTLGLVVMGLALAGGAAPRILRK